MRTFQLFLEGRWQDGPLRDVVKNPYDGAPAGEVHKATPAEIDRAIAYASSRERDVARVPAHRRADQLQKIASIIERRKEELAGVIRDEAGKPITLARAEAGRCVETFVMAAAECRRLDGEAFDLGALPRGEGRYGIVRRVPVGTIAAITPFNFPLNLAAHKVAPAIAAGCPIILKPADRTPLSAMILAECGVEAGLVDGALQVLPAVPENIGALITDDRVKMLSFTGSQKVGWELKSRAGKKRVALELGGNAGVIIMPDADVDALLGALGLGAFAYSGQVCISVQRVIVPANIQKKFEERWVEHVEKNVSTGNPADPATINGPMIDHDNVARVQGWVQEAKQMGARVLSGGTNDGNVVKPTILADVNPTARVYAEEAFGPVVTVEGFNDLDDAIRRINASRFGLQAGVFTNDLKALWRCYDELEVGGVIHNDVPTFRVDHMPYGGVKESGFGREGVRYAMEEMTERRLLALRP